MERVAVQNKKKEEGAETPSYKPVTHALDPNITPGPITGLHQGRALGPWIR